MGWGYARLNLRDAVSGDVEAICAIERMPEFRLFIGSWPPEQHMELMRSPDTRYFIAAGEQGEAVGFAILRGITSPHRSLELARLAVREPNRGIGRLLLQACLKATFDEYEAHRLWLDLFESNDRARHVYTTAGFRVDGMCRESILIDGRYHSMLLMSMLEHEYRATLI